MQRKVSRSRASALARQPPEACTGSRACPRRSRRGSGTATAGTKPTRNRPEARIDRADVDDEPVRVQRRHQRPDRRVQHQPAMPSSSTSDQRRRTGRGAAAAGLTDSDAQPGDARRANVTVSTNSYMLPHGIRLGGEPPGDQRWPGARRRRATVAADRDRPEPRGPRPAAGRRRRARRRPVPRGRAGRGRRPAGRRRRPAPGPGGASAAAAGDAAAAGRTRTRRREQHRDQVGQHGDGQQLSDSSATALPPLDQRRTRRRSRDTRCGAGHPPRPLPSGSQRAATPDGACRTATAAARPAAATAPASTIGSPGSCRTDTVIHCRVPRNSTLVPSSSVQVSPGRSSFGSPTCFSRRRRSGAGRARRPSSGCRRPGPGRPGTR